MNYFCLSKVCEINPKKILTISEKEEITFLPMESVGTDGSVSLEKTISCTNIKNYSFFQNGDVIFAKITPCMENGKGAIVNNLKNGYGAGSTEFIVLRPTHNVISKWIYYFLSQKSFRLFCQQNMTGSAGQKRVPAKFLAQCEIPVPPIPEQERIVARIEELFSQLDSGVETLKKTKEQLAVYRQAVLKEAFDFETDVVEISSIVEDIRIGPFGTALHKEDYIDGGIPVINPQHIKQNTIVPSSKTTISEAKASELTSYRLKANDIIMGRRGEMGRTAAITAKEEGWICGTGSIRFRLKSEYDAEFYAQILSSPSVVHYLEENATGTTMKNLNEEIVKHIPVPKITRQQQIEINSTLDATLSVCDSIEDTVDTALQQAEAMRQSILIRAFQGDLI